MNDILNNISTNLNKQLNEYKKINIDSIINLITKSNGNIYFTGVGKSFNIAKHAADLLKSINFKSFSLDLTNLNHGDFGTIDSSDLIFFFSKSGETRECINIIKYCIDKNITTIGITCKSNNKIKNLVNVHLSLPFREEIKFNEIPIPTNSCMTQLLFVNILASHLSTRVNINEYNKNHLGGILGYETRTIESLLITDIPIMEISKSKIFLIIDILKLMTKHKVGFCCFIENKKLVGILTDGDIRRFLIKNNISKYLNFSDINTSFHYEKDLKKLAFKIENYKKYKFIPILKNNELIGIIDCRAIGNVY